MGPSLVDVFIFAEAATGGDENTSQQATLAGVAIGLQVSDFRCVVLLPFH